MPIELNFCERGTDHSFAIEVDPDTMTGGALWEELRKCVLIQFENFVLLDEDSNIIKLPGQYAKLSTVPAFANDGALFCYYNNAFEPMTESEKAYATRLTYNDYAAIKSSAMTRPPVMHYLTTRLPKEALVQLFDAPLTELYYSIKPLKNEPTVYTNPEFVYKFARIVLSPDHRKTYWTAFLAKNPDSKRAKEEMRYVEGLELIQQSFLYANEYTPEIFGDVHMLYVPVELNGTEIHAFIDSGAQVSLISLDMAKRLQIDHLIDTRFKSKAKGVGQGNILGSIHNNQVKIAGEYFSMQLKVLDSLGSDFLLGLDNLKRHQFVINLKKNCLEFGDKSVEFLPEHKINEYAKKRMQEKIDIALRDKDDANNDSTAVDDAMLDHEERSHARLLMQQKQFPGQESGKMNGTLADKKPVTLRDMMTFMLNNMLDIKQSIDYVNQQNEFNVVQEARAGGVEVEATKHGRTIAEFKKPIDVEQITRGMLHRGGAAAGGRGGQQVISITASDPNLIAAQAALKTVIEVIVAQGDVDTALRTALEGMDERTQHIFKFLLQNSLRMFAQAQQSGEEPDMEALLSGLPPRGQQLGGQQQQRAAPVQPDPEKVKQLVELGFPKAEVERVLSLYNNDVELAAAALQDDDDDMRD